MSADSTSNTTRLIDRKETQNQRKDTTGERIQSSTINNSKTTSRQNDRTVKIKTDRGVVPFPYSDRNRSTASQNNDPAIKIDTDCGGIEQPLHSRSRGNKLSRNDERTNGASGGICRHFLSKGWCGFGENCRYSHVDAVVGAYEVYPTEKYAQQEQRYQSPERRVNKFNERHSNDKSDRVEAYDLVQPSKEKIETRKACRFFAAGHCRLGQRCPYLHEEKAITDEGPQKGSSGSLQKMHRNEPRSEVTKRAVESMASQCSHTAVQNIIQAGIHSQVPFVGNPLKDRTENNEKQQSRNAERYVNEPGETPQVRERPKPCRYFRSGYCRMGKRCKFLHEIRYGGNIQQDKYHHGTMKKQCLQDENGDEVHSKLPLVTETAGKLDVNLPPMMERFPEPSGVVCRPKVLFADSAAARKLEIVQLHKRFPESVEAVLSDRSSTIKFVFSPSDPDWPYDVKEVNMEVTFAENYPTEMMIVRVCEDGQMPETVSRMVTESIEDWIRLRHQSSKNSPEVSFDLAFRPMLRWFDKNAFEIFTNALKQLKREKIAEAAGIQFIPASRLRQIYNTAQHEAERSTAVSFPPLCDDGNTKQVLSSNGDQGSSVNGPSDETVARDGGALPEADAKQTADATTSQAASSVALDNQLGVSMRRGTEVTLQGFNIGEGVATVLASHVTIMVACQRCSRTCEVKTPCGRTNSVSCAYCHSALLVRFNSCIAHQFSAVIGYMDLNGCAAVDLVLADSTFIVGCLKCDKEVKMESFAPGQVNASWCVHCHQKLVVSTNSARFLTLQTTTSQLDSSGACVVEVKRPVRAVRDPLVQEGKPLPLNGTCKHYKKSFRWLRFPCCGKVYPCDICHDEKEDHEMKYANRMICGYCAKEQPYSAEGLCIGCQSCLTSRTTAHWEGGAGCRDKIKMSRNDDKKYANGSKTISRSSQTKKDLGQKTTKLRHAV